MYTIFAMPGRFFVRFLSTNRFCASRTVRGNRFQCLLLNIEQMTMNYQIILNKELKTHQQSAIYKMENFSIFQKENVIEFDISLIIIISTEVHNQNLNVIFPHTNDFEVCENNLNFALGFQTNTNKNQKRNRFTNRHQTTDGISKIAI